MKKTLLIYILLHNVVFCSDNSDTLSSNVVQAYQLKQSNNGNLLDAAWFGNTETIEKLLSNKNTDVDTTDANGQTALMMACIKEDIKAVKLLLKFSADVNLENTDHETALTFAKKTGNNELINLLKNNNTKSTISSSSSSTSKSVTVKQESKENGKNKALEKINA